MCRYSLHARSAAVTLALLLVACSPTAAVPPSLATATPPPAATQAQPDLTGKTIKVYGMGDLSGPSASTTNAVLAALKDMVNTINENGGILGAKVDLTFGDSVGKPDQGIALYDRWHGQDKNMPILLVFGTAEQQALKDRARQDHVPVLGGGPDLTALYSVKDGWEFASAPLYDEQFSYFLDYVVSSWPKIRPARAGDTIKLAYLSWNTATGQAALTQGSKAYMARLGVQLVDTDSYEASPKADTTPAILNAQATGANVIYNNTPGLGLANLLNDMRKLAARDQFVVGTGMLGMDLATYAFLADKSNADNVYGITPYGWYSDSGNPGIQTIVKIADKYGRDAKARGFGRLIASTNMDLARHVIEQAILKVGYDRLNGQAVYDALSQLKDYQVLGGLVTLDYTNGVRAGRQMQLRQIRGGPDGFILVKGFGTGPDLRPSP